MLAGPVKLLTNPETAGYLQNPISVYYCYDGAGGELSKCIAEVRQRRRWAGDGLMVARARLPMPHSNKKGGSRRSGLPGGRHPGAP